MSNSRDALAQILWEASAMTAGEAYVLTDRLLAAGWCNPEAERFWSKVDKTGDCWFWTATVNNSGYGTYWLDGKYVLAHRHTYALANGEIPDGIFIDHTCYAHHCVNPAHLRAATRKENGENRQGPQRNNTSGVLGVSWDAKNQRWRAKVVHSGKSHHVGRFENLWDAEAAVTAKRNELFTHNEQDRIFNV